MNQPTTTPEKSSNSRSEAPPIGGGAGSGDEFLVTIAITTYNRADGFLRDAILSALGQTYRNIQVVIADNCSEDHTASVVESFGDPRIDYMRHPSNIGPYRNFNSCIERARGKYFCLLHDDDLLDAEFVESCLARARGEGDVGLIQTGTRVIDGEGKILHQVTNRGGSGGAEEFVSAWFGGRLSPYLCSTLFVTDALREIGGFELNNTLCDVRAEFQLAQRFGWLSVEEVRASFRNHDDKLTHASKVKAWCVDSGNLLREMLAAVPPGRKAELRRQGKALLARMNYHRAEHVEGLRPRALAHLMVMQQFGPGHRPPDFKKRLRSRIRRAWTAAKDAVAR